MTLLSNCDSLDNWTIENATEYNIDNEHQVEGTGCIRIVSDAKYACSALFRQPGASYDFVSEPIFKQHIAVPDATKECLVSFGDGTTWGSYYVQPQLVNDQWVLIVVDTRNTPDEGETPNWAAITRIRIDYRVRNQADLEWWLDGPMEHVAEAPPRRTLIINTSVGGTTEPEPGTYDLEDGTVLTISATPAEGYVFERWTKNGEESTDNPLELTMDQDYTLTAYFEEEAAPPPEGTVRVDCNSLGPPSPAGWSVNEVDGVVTVEPYNGAIPRPPDVPAESTACIKAQTLDGRWNGYFSYNQPFGDWLDLTGEPVIRLRIFPEEYLPGSADILAIQVILHSEENPWDERSYPAKRADGNPIVGGAFNTLEFDTRIDEINGNNIIDLSRVRAFVIIWRTYERTNPPAVFIDWIESLPGGPVPPQVSVSPSAATIYLGDVHTFYALVGGGKAPYSYQWYQGTPPGGVLMEGEERDSLYLTGAAIGTTSYYVVVTDANGDIATSEAVTLTVAEKPSPPPPAGPVHFEGRLLKDESGNIVILGGVIGNNFTFMDHPAGSFTPVGMSYGSGALGWKPQTVQTHLDALRDFGGRCARIVMPIYDWWNNTEVPIWTEEGSGTIRFRDMITQLLNWSKERGIYLCFTIFGVFPLNTFADGVYTGISGGGLQDGLPFIPYLTSSEGVVAPGGITAEDIVPNWEAFADFWINFVNYYHERGASDNLIIDPANEPSPSADDAAMTAYTQAVQKIIDSLRGSGINNVIVYQHGYGFDGSNWGYTGQRRFFDFIDNYPLSDPATNILNTTHSYAWNIMRREPGYPAPPNEGPTDYESVLRRITNYSNWINPDTGDPEPHPEWGQHLDEYLARDIPIGIFEMAYAVGDAASRERGLNMMNIFSDLGLHMLGWWWCHLSTGPLWRAPFSIPPNFTEWGLDLMSFMRPSTIPPGKGRLTILAYVNSTSVAATVSVSGAGTVTTPTSIDVDPGEYTLVATYGSQQKEQTAKVEEQKVTTVQFAFGAPPTPPIDMGVIAASSLLIADLALIGYYIATVIGLV